MEFSIDKKKEKFKKMTIVELREVLSRETALVKNRKLLEKLPDKGESIREFHKLLESEIKIREQINNLGNSVKKLSVLDETEKHIQKLCEIEKRPEKDRYKPFATLNKTIEIKPNRKVFKVIEDCKLENHPTKLIPLCQSLRVLKQQEERVKEEQVKIRYERLMQKLKENTEDQSDSDERSSSESSLSEED